MQVQLRTDLDMSIQCFGGRRFGHVVRDYPNAVSKHGKNAEVGNADRSEGKQLLLF